MGVAVSFLNCLGAFSMNRSKLIIDVDTGIDDAQALVMALSDHRVDVMAVTVVDGNVPLEQATTNTRRILELCKRIDVTVYQGADRALLDQNRESAFVHGKDGLGDKPHIAPKSPVKTCVSDEHAALAIVRIVNKYPGEITLVALAPLTNVAVALKLDPDLGKKMKNLVMMGGNIHGIGNTTPSAEFNFYADPEAAYTVLKQMKCPKSIVPWEICINTHLPWEWYEKLKGLNTPKENFMTAINENFENLKKTKRKYPAYNTCDPLAMAVAICPEVATKLENKYCTVELNGSHTRGQMVVDWRSWADVDDRDLTQIVMEIDIEMFKTMFTKMLK